jgi:hypothetical protein
MAQPRPFGKCLKHVCGITVAFLTHNRGWIESMQILACNQAHFCIVYCVGVGDGPTGTKGNAMLKNGNGWFLQNHELYPLLGIGHKLPADGFEPVEVQGVQFKCEPAKAPRYTDRGRKVKVSKHRLFYMCKECKRWVPFGRAYQHRKGQLHKDNAANGGK